MKKTTVCVWGVSKMHEVQQAGGIRKCEDFCIRIASGLAFVSNRTIVYCKARCHWICLGALCMGPLLRRDFVM